MVMSPLGVVGIDADTDLDGLNERITIAGMKDYGKVITLFGEIDECIVVLDFPCPVPYVFAGGTIYANMICANIDIFDLDIPLPPYTWYTEAFYDHHGQPLIPEIPPVNPAIKMVVHNYAWTGYPATFFAEHTPTIVVGKEQAELFNRDPMNLNYMKHALLADDFDAAMNFAYRTAKIDQVIIFDGANGGINVSRPMAELLLNRAPHVDAKVDKVLMPKWLEQRNIRREVRAGIS
jgi:hypothetical protein